MPLDEQLQTLIDNLPGGIALAGDDAVSARAKFLQIGIGMRDHQPPADLAATEDLDVPSAEGTMPARIYRPHADGPTTTFVFVHGGGFVVGDIESYDYQARTLAERTGATVLSVDYRLAPEHPWPAAPDDVEAAARWALANVDKLGGDPQRVIIGGDSAGGNLAAVAAHALINETPGFSGLVMIYPSADLSRGYPSVEMFADGPVLTAEALMLFGPAYVGKAIEDGIELGDPRISPIKFDRHGEMPPTLIVTAEYDVLRDSGQAYAKTAREAGCDVRTLHFDTLPHGFVGLIPFSAACSSAVDEICAEFEKLLPKIGAAATTGI